MNWIGTRDNEPVRDHLLPLLEDLGATTRMVYLGFLMFGIIWVIAYMYTRDPTSLGFAPGLMAEKSIFIWIFYWWAKINVGG